MLISGEWSDTEIHETLTGFVVEFTSRISGARTGRKVLVPFGTRGPARRGADLAADWNEWTSYGQAIAMLARDGDDVRVLRRGHVVA